MMTSPRWLRVLFVTAGIGWAGVSAMGQPTADSWKPIVRASGEGANPIPALLPPSAPPLASPAPSAPATSIPPAAAVADPKLLPAVPVPGTASAECCATAPAAPVTWHNLKFRFQTIEPAGAMPIAPTGPGYYTVFDRFRGTPSEKAPSWPYSRAGIIFSPFNEADFSYLDKVPFADRDWAEKLKRIPVGDHWLLSTGGEVRYRYNQENNSRLSGKNDDYNLIRTRIYGDVWYENIFRFYAEGLYADSSHQTLAPLPRDINRGDFQQMFFDLKLFELNDNPIYARVGRQELIYGSQRLVSTNDWGDNRTRFDGAKVFYRSEELDADLFVTKPTLAKPTVLDPHDHNQTFSGAWLTYKPKKGTFLDLYYLDLENDNPGAAKGFQKTGSFNVSTFGSRYYSKMDNGLLIDVEGMLQFGHWADQSILAQSLAAYVGYYFKDTWGTPTFWAGYDYASGDPNPNGTGQHRTFNQLFQFGHYYYGYVDVTGGQNIRDYNVQAYLYPAKWLTTGLQYHVFRLDSNTDAMYNFSGGVLRQDKTGKSGDNIGSEIDVLTNIHLTDRQDIFLSYSHFFAGQFVKNTGPSSGIDYFYAQYSWRW